MGNDGGEGCARGRRGGWRDWMGWESEQVVEGDELIDKGGSRC